MSEKIHIGLFRMSVFHVCLDTGADVRESHQSDQWVYVHERENLGVVSVWHPGDTIFVPAHGAPLSL